MIGWEHGRRGVRPVFVDQRRRLRPPHLRHALRAQPGHLPEPAPLAGRRSRQGRRRGQGLRRQGGRGAAARGADRARRRRAHRRALRRRRRRAVGARAAASSPPRPSRHAASAATSASPARSTCWSARPQPEPPVTATLDERVAALDALSPDERFAFWTRELSRCAQCYACRQVCPLCYCERCIVEKTEPQWIETSPHARGNFAWHLTRAQHLAGRCVGCGECERACPVGIPLALINRKLQQVVHELYDYTVSEDPAVPAPIGAYATDDTQDFIK